MALAERSAQFIQRRLEEVTPSAPPLARRPAEQGETGLEFSEVMAGNMQIVGGEEVQVEFEVRASLNVDQTKGDGESSFGLEGMLRIPGIAKSAPCYGTLLMRPLERHATLGYTLNFQSDEGRELVLRGSKDVTLLTMSRGMTTLHTTIWEGETMLAQGILRFDLADLPSWLGTFRLLRPAD